MPFTLPVMNLICNIWRFGNSTSNPPDVVSACNLARGERASIALLGGTSGTVRSGGMWLLLPARTDIRDAAAPAGPDTVEVGAGTGRFYQVAWVDDAGGGFANEHRFAEIVKLGSWPVPFPGPVTIPPTSGFQLVTPGFSQLMGAPPTTSNQNFTTTNHMMFVLQFNSTAPATIMTSASVGTLTPTGSGFIETDSGISCQWQFYQWTGPIGVEVITGSGQSGGGFAANCFSLNGGTLDGSGAKSMPASPLTDSTTTTIVSQVLLSAFSHFTISGSTPIVPPTGWGGGTSSNSIPTGGGLITLEYQIEGLTVSAPGFTSWTWSTPDISAVQLGEIWTMIH